MKLKFKAKLVIFASLVTLTFVNGQAFAELGVAPPKSLPHPQYVQGLKSGFGRRVIYADDNSRERADAYIIDCKTSNKRGLRLSTLLLARAASASQSDMWLATFVEAKGEQIRVYDHLVKPDGEWVTEPTLRLEIDQWGDLTPYGIRAEGILNSCFGSYGPIWE